MSRRILEKERKKAAQCQKKVDRLVRERANLLDNASRAEDFKTRADIWKVVAKLEGQIEREQRMIRRLLTKQSTPNQQPSLWDFPEKKR